MCNFWECILRCAQGKIKTQDHGAIAKHVLHWCVIFELQICAVVQLDVSLLSSCICHSCAGAGVLFDDISANNDLSFVECTEGSRRPETILQQSSSLVLLSCPVFNHLVLPVSICNRVILIIQFANLISLMARQYHL